MSDNFSLRNNSYHTYNNLNKIYLAGISYGDLIKKYNFSKKDLDIFLPLNLMISRHLILKSIILVIILNGPQETFIMQLKIVILDQDPLEQREHIVNIIVLMIKLMIFITIQLL